MLTQPLRVMALLATCLALAPARAALAPQPFLAPPQLPENQPSVAVTALMLKSAAAPSPCKPAGDITRSGHEVLLKLQVQMRPNEIYNPGNPNGAMDRVELRSYGGCLSGPLLDLSPGNTLRVHLDNQLSPKDPTCPDGSDPPDGSAGCFNTINMHFHGLHVSPSGNSDNVLLNIRPQTRFEYEVNIPADHPAGTFWYHAHRHGSTATQVASGAAGPLIIRGTRRYEGKAPGDVDTILHDAAGRPFPEQIFLFQQIPYACFDDQGKIITTNGQWTCPPGKTGIVQDFNQQLASPTVWDDSGRFTSINGVVQPVLRNVPAGQVQRWRFIHAGIHDTINLQIVPMVAPPAGAQAALSGVLAGTRRQQVAAVTQLCPVLVPDKSRPVELVPQFEIASDGLTRKAIRPIGVDAKSISGGIGSNYLQPGYRSDVLLAFPKPGVYCILNQAATPAERINGGQGPNVTQLLATVIVSGGTPVKGDLKRYVLQALYDGNKASQLPPPALQGLLAGDLSPWQPMSDLSGATVNPAVQQAHFFIGNLPEPPKTFGFYINNKSYDPDRVDYTRQVGTTDDWVLTSTGEPHIYHIHVNPFQVMDVLYAPQGATPKSIFGPRGECLVKPNELGLQNQYCGMWREFRDTVFVQNDYLVKIRTRYDRYIGEFVMHCHILDHEDSGMMANVRIVPDLGAPGGGVGMAGMKHGDAPKSPKAGAHSHSH